MLKRRRLIGEETPRRGIIGEDLLETRPARRQRPSEEEFAGIVEALHLAELQPETIKMLVAGMPCALGAAKSERHEVQHRIAKMIGSVLETVKGKLQQSADASNARVAELEQRRELLVVKAKQSHDDMREAAQMNEAKILARVEAGDKVKAAMEAAEEKKTAQQATEALLVSEKKSMEACTEAAENHFMALMNWTVGDEGPEPHTEVVLPLLRSLPGLEESCLMLAPHTCKKPPEARSTIDVMAFQEIEKAMAAKIDLLAQSIIDLAARVEVATEDATVAVENLEEVKTSCSTALEEGMAAASQERESRVAAIAAQHELENFTPGLTQLMAEQQRNLKRLGNFVEHNLGCFKKFEERERSGAEESEAGGVGAAGD